MLTGFELLDKQNSEPVEFVKELQGLLRVLFHHFNLIYYYILQIQGIAFKIEKIGLSVYIFVFNFSLVYLATDKYQI